MTVDFEIASQRNACLWSPHLRPYFVCQVLLKFSISDAVEETNSFYFRWWASGGRACFEDFFYKGIIILFFLRYEMSA